MSMNLYKLTAITSLYMLLGSCVSEPSETQVYDFEIVPANEQVQIDDIARKTMELQNRRAVVFRDQQDGQKLRGVHPKAHGCVVADFEINRGISNDLQVGLFSNPGRRYKALVRYSNASVRLSPDLEDDKNASRGMAIKVFDVGETVLVKDQGRNQQDFLMINTRAFAFPNVRSYQRLTDALIADPSGTEPDAAFAPADDWTAEDIENLQKTGKVVAKIGSKVVRNPLEVQYFAAAPSSFGSDRVMKFSAEPCGGEKTQAPFSESPPENYLHEALASSMRSRENACFDFKIQVLRFDQVRDDRNIDDETRGGDLIEDATRVWDEKEYPFTSVARITINAPQSIELSSAAQQSCESQAFNPWHSLAEHKPLGGINRLRKPVYDNSARNRKTVWLEQGWKKADSDWFHHVSQGAATFPIPYEWFMALGRPIATDQWFSEIDVAGKKFSDTEYLQKFGFIASENSEINPDGLPIGFAKTVIEDDPEKSPIWGSDWNAIGLTCAGCHTGQMTYKDWNLRIEGGPALIDLTSLGKALVTAVIETDKIPSRYEQFEQAYFLGKSPSDNEKSKLRQQVKVLADEFVTRATLASTNPAKAVEEGFTRLDALNGIGNAVFGGNGKNLKPSNAPVNFPHLWSASWFDWVQYDASIMQPIIRNAGEALGLRARTQLHPGVDQYRSTAGVENLSKIEILLAGEEHPQKGKRGFKGLTAPKWPEHILGEIDPDNKGLVETGKKLYAKHCKGCHRPAVQDDEFWSDNYWKPIRGQGNNYYNVVVVPLTKIGTDLAQSNVLAERTVDIEDLGMEGEVCARIDGNWTTVKVNAGKTESFAFALGLAVEKVVNRYYDDHEIDPEERKKMNGARPNCLQAGQGYKARPLNGIWATAPFLHNGSVANLYEMLVPASQRASTLYLGYREFDPIRVGYISTGADLPSTKGLTKVVVSGEQARVGNRNTGHEFRGTRGPGVVGPLLADDERWALVAYLKTL